jgi:DNA replication protein DnaC
MLIIDDVGLGQVKKRDDEPTAAHALFNLIDRRHGKVSTAVTSNIALSDWGRYLGDPTLTAAILDRLAMHAIRIDIDGPSYRQHVAEKRAHTRDDATPTGDATTALPP